MVFGFRKAAVLACFALAAGAAPAFAQENLDAGKSPAQLFNSDCAICHKSAQGLSKSGGLLGLSSFLREHYTASRETAALLAAYLKGVDGAAPAAKPGQVRRARATKPKSDDDKKKAEEAKEKSDDAKSAHTTSGDKHEAKKPDEAKSAEKPADSQPKDSKSSEAPPAASAEQKPDAGHAANAKSDSSKPASSKSGGDKPTSDKSDSAKTSADKPADVKSEKQE